MKSGQNKPGALEQGWGCVARQNPVHTGSFVKNFQGRSRAQGPASFLASPRAEGREGQASKEHPGCSQPLLFLCSNSSPTHPVEALPVGSDVSECGGRGLPAPAGESEHRLKACALCPQHLLPSASMQDAQQWLHRNRFSQFCRLFASFSGEHL